MTKLFKLFLKWFVANDALAVASQADEVVPGLEDCKRSGCADQFALSGRELGEGTVELKFARGQGHWLRTHPILRLLFALSSAALTGNSPYPAKESASNIDVVDFFYKAITAPPDVEHFVGTYKPLREPAVPTDARAQARVTFGVQTFEGARAGSNFYLRGVGQLLGKTNLAWDGMVGGRAGSNSYQLNRNTLTRTTEMTDPRHSNPVAGYAQGLYSLTLQFLNMGLGDVVPESVSWLGSEFSGKRTGGSSVFGHLYVTNSLPVTLVLRSKRGEAPYKSISYTYPEPRHALGGFPEVIIISNQSHDISHPAIEIQLHEVKLSLGKLPESFFKEDRFVGAHIQNTNIYSNGSRFALRKGGGVERLPSTGFGPANGGISHSRRALILIILAVMTCGLLLILKRLARTNS